ncbi:hypothetical protein [Campylobacter sp. 19-13652]|uniref:hypothetical protein n=1 Tax=Campylobacter sp. 19-13652 TaxID=2840180 RepID=UPI001C778D94|nr:hypothetical protein [Campylobacter sp. 19-13652]BCX79235.1 hypothetical protein LBC_06970 [Campylobacter sp. 19-13652]
MQISNEFNRFMHGVVLSYVHSLRYLKIEGLRVGIRPFYLSFDALKQLLKYLDFDYPRNELGVPISYTRLSVFDMLSHIAFIQTVLAENGLLQDFLDEFYKEIESV